ncbi:MAG: PspC domain-containing protein [bacterium]|nr:PspC domain-containing protein [bacterium]
MNELRRSRENKMLAGVCGGMGEYFGMDPVIIRVIVVLVTLVLAGVPILLYILGALVIPSAPEVGPAAGVPVRNTGGSTPGQGNMEDHVRILGFLYIGLSVLELIAAFIIFAVITGGGMISGDETTMAVTSAVAVSVAGLLVLLAAPGIIGGIGLLKHQGWSRVLVLLLGFISLPGIPLGTALGIYTIWCMTNKETEELFKNKPY